MRKSITKFSKIITYLILFCLIASVVGFLVVFTNGFTTSVKSFYVEVNGKQFVADGRVSFDDKNELQFDVRYLLDYVTQEKTNYNVKLIPNVKQGNNFTYYVNGANYSFSNIKDLTDGVDLVKKDSCFTLKIDKSMQQILESLYPNRTVELAKIDYDKYSYFTIVITSEDGKSVINLDVYMVISVDGITLDKGEIVF